MSVHSHFSSDLAESSLILNPPTNLADLIECYNSTLAHLLNWYASLIVTRNSHKPSYPWCTLLSGLLNLCAIKAERTLKRTHSLAALAIFKLSQSKYLATVRHAKQHYHFISSF